MTDIKIVFANFSTRAPVPLDNPTVNNALDQAIAISITDPECIYLLRITTSETKLWRIRGGVILFHITVPVA